jgi:hypothetical protein
MQLPAYDHKLAKWDTYRRFHNVLAQGLVVFENGEAIITHAAHDPGARRNIMNSDLQIVSSGDDDCPRLKLVPDESLSEALTAAGYTPAKVYESPIPKVWLQDGGSQLLLVDKTTGRTIQMSNTHEKRHAAWDSSPHWLSVQGNRYYDKAKVYFPGSGKGAIGNKARVTVPVLPDKETRDALTTLIEGCRAWCNMLNNDYTKLAPDFYKVEAHGNRYLYQVPFSYKGAVPKMEDLKGEQRFQINIKGFARRTATFWVDHLNACL